MSSFIHETAIINESLVGTVKLFRNVVVSNSKIADGCSIGDDSTVERCEFENSVIINRRSFINDSFVGRYSYAGINTTINWTKLGRFCSLARNVDIGGFDHDYKKVTTMPAFRFSQMLNGGGKLSEYEELSYCEIGNDVWIAAGAHILHKVKIGDGAVIGAGAVVTHDVPAYAIVAGVPAKIAGFRCADHLIEEMLEIKWWDWDENTIRKYADYLMHNELCNESVCRLKEISAQK